MHTALRASWFWISPARGGSRPVSLTNRYHAAQTALHPDFGGSHYKMTDSQTVVYLAKGSTEERPLFLPSASDNHTHAPFPSATPQRLLLPLQCKMRSHERRVTDPDQITASRGSGHEDTQAPPQSVPRTHCTRKHTWIAARGQAREHTMRYRSHSHTQSLLGCSHSNHSPAGQ